MTTKILTGTYNAGYTLSASYTGLSIASTGVVRGVTATYFGSSGGTGVLVTFAAPVANAGALVGGGGAGGYPGSSKIAPGPGGSGGAGVDLTAGGSLYNQYVIAGGSGGIGGGAPHAARGGYGGDGVRLGASGTVNNIARITGGTGGAGGSGTYGGNGGRGGAGVNMAAGGHVTNSSTVAGGLGGAGSSAFRSGSGGAGGAGVEMSGPGTVTNNALIEGGAGGAYGSYGGTRGLAGQGGAGVALNKGGTLLNNAAIYGGEGYRGGYGGAGAVLAAGGGITNKGPIRGGQGGYDGRGGDGIDLVAGGTVTNSNLIVGGSAAGAIGKGGAGASLTAGGSVHNLGTIEGGSGGDGVDIATSGAITNGGAGNKTALIYGAYGISAGATGAATVTNFGSIQGPHDSVRFQSAKDRLIVEASAVFIGTAVGGGGTLEFAGGGETVTNLGAAGSMGGSTTLYFNGFGTYQIDSAATWTFLGGNVVNSGDTLIDKGTLNLAAGSSVSVANGGTVQIQGPVANGGAIALTSTGSNTDIKILGAGATLSGGGTVTVSGPKARIFGASAATTLTNVDNTITGEGFIGLASMSLVNQGLIDDTAAGNLVVNTKGAVLVNSGQMFAFNGGGTLIIASTTVDQTGGGVIGAGSGGTVELQDDVIIGGSLAQGGTGVFKITGSGGELEGTALNFLSVSGVVQVVGGVSLTLDRGFTNTGELDTLGGSKVTKLIVGADGVTLTSGGQLNLSASVNNIISGAASSDTLTNVDNRIAGAGNIGNGSMKLVNQAAGAIIGDSAITLTLDTGTNKVTNAGLIASEGTGSVVVKSAVSNTGTLFASTGTLTLDGAVSGGGVGQIQTGVLNIAAAFAETVTFLGGATGQLRLTDFKDFTGTARGLSKTGANSIDLAGFTLTGAKATYSGTTASGTLTVTNGTQTAKIKLAGNYIGATFTLASDGHGGVLVKDPAAGTAGSAAVLAGHMAGMAARPWAAAWAAPVFTPRPAAMLARPALV